METTAPFLTQTKERIFTLDVIRGFALLGILLMNITAAGLTGLYDEGAIHFYKLNPADYYTWFITSIFVNGKMRCLFSMLFGAGIILFTERKQEGASTTAAYYRRTLWLLGFGAIDLFIVMWQGDILHAYALCGLLIFFCRKWKPVFLLLTAFVFICVLGWRNNENFSMAKEKREGYLLVEQMRKEGKKPTAELDTLHAKWLKKEKRIYPFTKEVIAEIKGYVSEDITSRQHTLAEGIASQAVMVPMALLDIGFYMDLLEAMSAMLLGMALFRWGFFSGAYSLKKYLAIAITCFLIALPLAYAITRGPLSHAAQNYTAYLDKYPFDLNVLEQLPRVLMAISFAAFLIIICKLNILNFFTKAFAAIGKMAFTNYMVQNIFFTLMFQGFAFNKFMAFTRNELFLMVPLIWMIQGAFSVWWLKRYSMGPLEWLWRSLTYRKILPNKIKKLPLQ